MWGNKTFRISLKIFWWGIKLFRKIKMGKSESKRLGKIRKSYDNNKTKIKIKMSMKVHIFSFM